MSEPSCHRMHMDGYAGMAINRLTCGSSACGVQRRAWREMSAVLMVKAGDHWSLSMSCVGEKRRGERAERGRYGTKVRWHVDERTNDIAPPVHIIYMPVRVSRLSATRTKTHGPAGASIQLCVCTRCLARLRTRQMAPVEEEMLGCQILVLNFILGGSKGYEAGTTMSILKTPPVCVSPGDGGA